MYIHINEQHEVATTDQPTSGVLVQCDASIKAIICNIDDDAKHDFITEDLDDETVVVKSTKIDELKRRLQEVCGVAETT